VGCRSIGYDSENIGTRNVTGFIKSEECGLKIAQVARFSQALGLTIFLLISSLISYRPECHSCTLSSLWLPCSAKLVCWHLLCKRYTAWRANKIQNVCSTGCLITVAIDTAKPSLLPTSFHNYRAIPTPQCMVLQMKSQHATEPIPPWTY
jgi:hypothetical protein